MAVALRPLVSRPVGDSGAVSRALPTPNSAAYAGARYGSYDAAGNPNGPALPSLAALAAAAKAKDDAEAERQRAVTQSRDEHDASMRALELQSAQRQDNQAVTAAARPAAPVPTYATESYAPAPSTAPGIDYGAIASLRAAATPAAVSAPSQADNKAVSDTAFARAKDKAGLLALRRTADARTNAMQHGTTGGGRELADTDAILGDTADNLTGVATAQAEQEAARGYQTADRNYAAALQQRSQDISLMPTLLSLISAQRRY